MLREGWQIGVLGCLVVQIACSAEDGPPLLGQVSESLSGVAPEPVDTVQDWIHGTLYNRATVVDSVLSGLQTYDCLETYAFTGVE
jgi:hypothetical protein